MKKQYTEGIRKALEIIAEAERAGMSPQGEPFEVHHSYGSSKAIELSRTEPKKSRFLWLSIETSGPIVYSNEWGTTISAEGLADTAWPKWLATTMEVAKEYLANKSLEKEAAERRLERQLTPLVKMTKVKKEVK